MSENNNEQPSEFWLKRVVVDLAMAAYLRLDVAVKHRNRRRHSAVKPDDQIAWRDESTVIAPADVDLPSDLGDDGQVSVDGEAYGVVSDVVGDNDANDSLSLSNDDGTIVESDEYEARGLPDLPIGDFPDGERLDRYGGEEEPVSLHDDEGADLPDNGNALDYGALEDPNPVVGEADAVADLQSEEYASQFAAASAPYEEAAEDAAEAKPRRNARRRSNLNTRGGLARMFRGRRNRTDAHYPSLGRAVDKAELICRLDGDFWELFLSIPYGRKVVKATLDGSDLSEPSGGEIALETFKGDLLVQYETGAPDTISLFDSALGDPLFFKMRDGWVGQGKRCWTPSQGHILAIAPVGYENEVWEDYEAHEPEYCADEDFRARFLFLPGKVVLTSVAPIVYEGVSLYDDSDSDFSGELFVGSPPDLVVDEDVTEAVIVEERGGFYLNEWKEKFNPHTQPIASVLGGRTGRFSVRTYVDSARREDSAAFRYFPDLRQISVNGEAHSADAIHLPDRETGLHRDLEIRFETADGGLLRPCSVEDDFGRILDNGAVVVAPDPLIGAVSCEFDNHAAIEVSVPRVWWRLIDETGNKGEWSGKAHEFSYADFMGLVGSRFEIRAPRAVNVIELGFGGEMKVSLTRRSLGPFEFDLVGFGDYEELADPIKEDLALNVRINGVIAPIARVLAIAEDEGVSSSADNKAHAAPVEVDAEAGSVDAAGEIQSAQVEPEADAEECGAELEIAPVSDGNDASGDDEIFNCAEKDIAAVDDEIESAVDLDRADAVDATSDPDVDISGRIGDNAGEGANNRGVVDVRKREMPAPIPSDDALSYSRAVSLLKAKFEAHKAAGFAKRRRIARSYRGERDHRVW